MMVIVQKSYNNSGCQHTWHSWLHICLIWSLLKHFINHCPVLKSVCLKILNQLVPEKDYDLKIKWKISAQFSIPLELFKNFVISCYSDLVLVKHSHIFNFWKMLMTSVEIYMMRLMVFTTYFEIFGSELHFLNSNFYFVHFVSNDRLFQFIWFKSVSDCSGIAITWKSGLLPRQGLCMLHIVIIITSKRIFQ